MKKLFLTLTMLLLAFTGTMKAESLTVHDGTTTNGNVPVYGFYADAYNKCEMVYPAAELSEMAGGTINSLTFYASQTSVNWGANFQVFVAEVADATISAFAGPGTVVYEGQLSIADGEMVVTFDTPYTYGGGNLLVGFYQTSTGSYITSTWYGESVTGASGSGYDYSGLSGCNFGQRNFLPKTTFDYTVGGGGGELVEVTIGDPTSTTTSSYLPGYTLYDYSISQQIYTADEIGVAGTINTLTVWLKNTSSYARNINVYMKEVEATEFASNTAWESFAAADMVASFTMPNGNDTPIEVALPLNTPFEYSGSGSLAICFQDVTGQWSSGLGGVIMDATGNQAIYAYRDGTVYDPSNPGVSGTLLAKKNVIRLSIMTGGDEPTTAFTTIPEVLDLGYRPNGAWMAPYTFAIKSNIGAATINALDFSGNYFTYNAELPAEVSAITPLNVELTTGTAEEGLVESTMTIMYSADRDIEQHPVTAYAYNPVDGDVWETAIEVTSFPYQATAPQGIYKNYELPEETEGADAVYKVTFNNDVLFSAGTTGEDAVAYIYEEGFNGVGGPSYDNYYEYLGPEVAPAPIDMWFSYSYTGSNTWYGSSAGGGMMWGYKIPAAMLQELGLGNCAILTVESAARNATTYEFYDVMLLKGGDTPDLDNIVYYQEFSDFTPGYWFDVNLDEPQFLGDDENIWVMFYSDAPYAAYCGRYPVDTNNGKIWYTTNLTDWYSSTTYTPMIYTHFLELSTGREVTVDLGSMKIRESKPANGQIAEAEGNAMGVAKGQERMARKAQSNRAVDPTYQIADMYVPAGTYYVAIASTTDNFDVNMMVSEVPAPEQALVIAPFDGETNVENPYIAEWIIGDYTTEMQVLFGTQYPPQTILIDWTTELVAGAFLPELEPNQSYFLQVNERNAYGTTNGEIVAFTTPIDGVEGFAVEEDELYPGDAAVFTWEAANRSFKGYNLYMYDGVEITKVNETLITTNTYAVEDLAYNMDGYQFAVTAVYDAGESVYSDAVTVYMTGFGSVSGHVYDTDVEHPIANATIIAIGVDEYENIQEFEFTTDETGLYEGEILAGLYAVGIVTEGYENEAVVAFIEYNQLTEADDIITHEFYYPLNQITATEEENDVLVEWSWDPAELIVDFETGDFSQAEFTLPATYPWAITTTNPYEGTYCMKSTCEGVASGSSVIEATVDVPFDEAKMGFYVRVSSESNYDKFHFYIDGVEQGAALSGQAAYVYKEYSVTGGVHTYKWEYTKDSSVNSNDDCIYVDNITMFRKDEPIPPTPGATVYDFDDDSMMGWTSIDADGDGNGWVSSANPGIYHNSGVNLSGTGHNDSEAYVISGSYANQTGQALTPDNYLVAPAQISAQDGASISFWACAQDASYAAEHFGVAVSTTGHTSGNDFTTIQEWTMTAKGTQGKTADAERDIRGTRQGSWYSYTVDLSSYAGQDIWVAIRHFNCTDMFILNVDDITLYDGSAKDLARGDRSFMSFNLYRRNNYSEASVADPELIAEGLAGDVFEYIDNEWPTLSFGEWQWGIAATYAGYASDPERTIASSVERNADDNANGVSSSSTSCREMWDLLFQFDGTSGYQYGVATDGNYIYTSSWSSSSTSMFYKYDMEGNFVEEFNISGCGQLRGMTYDGQYFYGVANSSTVYCVDLANHALINSFTTSYGAMRCITYDPERDGFWVVGNWSGNLTLISRTGAIVQAGPAPSSASDVAYYKDENNVEHVYCFNNGTNDVDDYNIANNTITSAVFNVSGSAITGSAGGCFVGTYDDKTCFFADIQQSPQYIAIYELNASSAPVPPTPPTPGPTGDGISEILWSNVIEKDMEATVTFNITLNNGQSPVGATIEIVGEETYTEIAEGATTVIEVRKAPNYDITVSLDGYTDWTYSGAIEADQTFDITLNEIVAPVDGLYVSPTGWVMWEGIGGGVTPGPGPGPQPGNNSFTEGFEGGLNGWNVLTINADGGEWIHSDDNLGGYDYTELAHDGTGFAMCYSYVDYVGAYNTDSYLYTPQKYAIENGSTLTFWADNANDTYPESFSVCIATVDNPTSAADFTQVWSGGAKGTANGGEIVRHQNNRYQNWRSHNIDLSAYAGQEVYIAFHDVNYDAYEIWIDDVELGVANKGDRAPLKYVVKLDGVVDGETNFNGFQHNVEGMEEGSTHVTAVRPVYLTGNGDWVEYTWTYTSCDNFAGVTDLAAAEQGNDVKLTWTMPGTPGPGPGPQPGGSTFTEGFEGGLNGWNVLTILADGGSWIHSSNNLGGYDYTSHAHGGTGFAMCYSFVDYVGSFNTDSYMYTPEMYTIGNGSTLTFWADNANDSYPESFSVVISTSANPSSASDFTTVWSGSAKGTRSDGAKVRHTNNRYDNWRQHTVDLSAYAGQTVYIGFHDVNYDMYEVWIDDVELGVANKGNRDMWDYVASFTGTSAGQQAVCTDGEYIYTASWQSSPTGGHTFYQYTMDGTFVEGFEIAGATGIRDITTDGEYFYGTSGGAQIFIMDFTTRTLVGTINCSGLTSRHISYDPERDGFWSGNWSTLALYSRTGALIQNGPAPTSAYGSAYYKDADNVEHLFLFCQPNSDAKVYDYNITTNTLGTDVVFDFASTPGFNGIAGGCFVGEYNGNTCWYGNSQQDPNLIGIFELEAGTPGPVPPTPVEGILGAMIFQDGEPIAFVEGNPTQYVVEGAASYDATYGVRVVYGGEYDVTYYAMSCMEEVDYSGTVVPCNPVANLTAEDYTYNGNHGALVSWTEPAGATSYKIYVDGELLGSLTGQPIFINFEGTPGGTYTIGVVAVYAECESEMVTVDFLWTPVSVDEISANTNIYPNPTHDNVTIEAQGMRHITVVSALGQVVYDADIEADMTQLNLGQFKAGLYMVRIDTENGTVVKRVSVVK